CPIRPGNALPFKKLAGCLLLGDIIQTESNLLCFFAGRIGSENKYTVGDVRLDFGSGEPAALIQFYLRAIAPLTKSGDVATTAGRTVLFQQHATLLIKFNTQSKSAHDVNDFGFLDVTLIEERLFGNGKADRVFAIDGNLLGASHRIRIHFLMQLKSAELLF